jgi:competence protein ComEA
VRGGRHADVDEPGESLRRLSRLVGDTVAGWTPAQPVLPPGSATAVGDGVPPLPSRRALVAAQPRALAWLVVVGLVAVLASGWLLSRHHGSPGADAGSAPVAAVPAPSSSPAPAGIVVDVGGRVRHPGLVTLPAGARVADAIAAAGGVLRQRDLLTVNLAARVTDGQLLLIGVPGAAVASAGVAGGSAGPVDLNSATVEQLDALPGVGPVLAQRIVDWRTAHGGFRSVDDLQQVAGIGARKFADLQALVTA